MVQTADQIRTNIEYTRAKLGQDLNELQYKVRQETDWRVHMARRPWRFLGVVFAVAMLFGFAFSTKRH
jgi:ElaB/YqjD/DUF883 family membrane-anchored ribosome-binding protein